MAKQWNTVGFSGHCLKCLYYWRQKLLALRVKDGSFKTQILSLGTVISTNWYKHIIIFFLKTMTSEMQKFRYDDLLYTN